MTMMDCKMHMESLLADDETVGYEEEENCAPTHPPNAAGTVVEGFPLLHFPIPPELPFASHTMRHVTVPGMCLAKVLFAPIVLPQPCPSASAAICSANPTPPVDFPRPAGAPAGSYRLGHQWRFHNLHVPHTAKTKKTSINRHRPRVPREMPVGCATFKLARRHAPMTPTVDLSSKTRRN
jgi:hypothetical protein